MQSGLFKKMQGYFFCFGQSDIRLAINFVEITGVNERQG